MHCICMIKILYNGMLLCISSHLYVQQHHVGKLKSAMVEVFTQGTIANTIYKSASFFSSENQWLNIYQHTTAWEPFNIEMLIKII